MGANGGIPGNAISSSNVQTLPQYLSLEQISFGNQKCMRSGELRRALGFPLASASEDHMFRISNFKPSASVAIVDIKNYKEDVLNASLKARERSKFFRNSIFKLDNYMEVISSKKRQRSPLSNERPGGASILKTQGQPSRYLIDQSAQRLEDWAKCTGTNKRFRSATEVMVDSKSGSLSRDLLSNVKDTNITKAVAGASVQPEERTLRLSAVGEGWEKNMRRKRSFGTVVSRATDNDMKRMQTKLNSDMKLAACDTSAVRLSSRSNAKQDTSSGSTGTNTKGKFSRAPRTGSLMVVNSADVQASSESREGGEQHSSPNKVNSLGAVQNNHHAPKSSRMLSQWGGQRQQKSARSRRINVVSPVTNQDECQTLSLNSVPSAIAIRSPLHGNSGSFDSADIHNIDFTGHSKIKVENTPSPGRLSEVDEILGLVHGVEEKEKDNSEVALRGKGKVGAFVLPTKRNKNFLNENGVNGMRKQGRTVRGLSLSGVPEVKLDNISIVKGIQNTRHGSEKIRGKSGRPPLKKMSDGRANRSLESGDDLDELLAAAASARKASGLSCSGRLWKKLEPVFCSVSPQDVSHLKQQLSFAEELEDSQSLVSSVENNFLGVPTHKERDDVPSGRKGSNSDQVVDKNEPVPVGVTGERNVDNFTSLYQRVLCALIEDDENDGICTGYEGATAVSFQCASDDSHCGSCNYTDAETRDRDRFESEAESIVDFQISKRYSGDRISCNKSVTSNTTWNTSMSDSLYSSGRWLGDDGLSYSDAEFVGGGVQNDAGGPQGVTASGAYFDCQYELMCVDDKLMMELQSIGLYPDELPDLAEGEVIDQDITELKDGLSDQIGKKKIKLAKIDSAVQDDSQRDKRFMEQVAMEQLIQMAYKRRMAYRRNNASKTIIRKVSKQVAMGFIERTLARCKAFEVTGRSCFSEPALQNVLFATPKSTDAGNNKVNNAYIANGSPKHLNTSKADSAPQSLPDSCVVDFSGSCIDSAQAACKLFDNCFPKLESTSYTSTKRELLLDAVGGAAFDATTTHGGSRIGGAKGKSTENHRDNKKGALMIDSVRQNPSVGGLKSEEKPRAKSKQRASATRSLSTSIQQQVPGNERDGDMWLPSSFNDLKDSSINSEEPIDFDSIAQNDTGAPEDLNDWFKDLPDGDFTGCLDIPMDDLSMVL
ncbi:hypothetical protein KSS87_002832 [Heliosperma pusillum]|nr:hypothetical protein KSS87_002832 [Heliosperma pusillum]